MRAIYIQLVFRVFMSLSPFFASIAVLAILALSLCIVLRVYFRFRARERLYRDILSVQEGAIFQLGPDLGCEAVLPSSDSVRYNKQLGNGASFLRIVADDYHAQVVAAAKVAVERRASQTVVFQLKSGEDIPKEFTWAKVTFCPLSEFENVKLFAMLKNLNEMMRLQNVERESMRQQECIRKTSSDILWRLDIETRQVHVLNDIEQERHGAISRPSGFYELTDVVFPGDTLMLEREINFRVSQYLQNGRDLYERRVMNVRMRAPNASGVWHSLAGVVSKDDDGRLLMYGATHRIATPEFSTSPSFGTQVVLRSLMRAPSLRVFWCDMEGRIVGCNRVFAVDLEEVAPENLVGKKIADLEGVNREWCEYFFRNLKSIEGNPIAFSESREFLVKKTTFDSRSHNGKFDMVPLRDVTGQMYGCLFVYWFDAHGENPDILTFGE